jgi:hypothetical protein
MRNRTTYVRTVAVLLAGALLVPAAALARGGGFAHFGHGPVFGFHRAPDVAHRPFRPPGVQHFPGRFAGWWRLHRFGRNRGDNGNGTADAGYGGSYWPGSGYGSADTTGTVTPGAVWTPPSAPPSERGCVARGYDVPGESGGVVKVTVTRC